MKLKYVFYIFLLILVLKLFFLFKIYSPHIVFDESNLFIQANYIWYNHTYFTGQYLCYPQYPPLYALLLSPASVFSDVLTSYKVMLAINCVASSTVVFPAYYLAKEYLKDREIWFVVILIGVLPVGFTYTYTIMGENLFVPLFLCSIYFLKKTLDKDNFQNNLLAGVFISLTVLTKLTGVVLVGIYIGIKVYIIYTKRR